MGFQTNPRSLRNFDQQSKKAKSKALGKKNRTNHLEIFEEKQPPSLEEAVERIRTRLLNLGNQYFALPPFSAHFNRWLLNLRDELSNFESNPALEVDEQYIQERTQILSGIEINLTERRNKESNTRIIEKPFTTLSKNKALLKQIEEDYSFKSKEIEERKKLEITRLSNKVDALNEELEQLNQTKLGFLNFILKNNEKKAEATQRLNLAQQELTSAEQYFTNEEKNLQDEYEKKKHPIKEQIQHYQKEREFQEIDGSLESRRTACEALNKTITTLLQRNIQIKNKLGN